MAPGSASPSALAPSFPAVETPADASADLKLPPPEKESDITRRSYIVLSFWLVVVFLGLPIWWKTTTIYRANLPLDGMLEWAEGKVRNSVAKPIAPSSWYI